MFTIFKQGIAISQIITRLKIMIRFTYQFHIIFITWFTFQTVCSQTTAKASHQVIGIGIIYCSPYHLKYFLTILFYHCTITGPIKIILINITFLYFFIRQFCFRMANMGTRLIISFSLRVIRLNVICQPNQIIISFSGRSI